MKVEEYQEWSPLQYNDSDTVSRRWYMKNFWKRFKNRLEEYKINGILDSGMLEQLT